MSNAGLLDQHFALQWVQQYIHLFNGDKSRVTIAGESAGAGSVMLQAMAYGGTRATELFVNAIGASPYLPMQYGYKDWIPPQAYYAFTIAAGCDVMDPYLHNGSLPIFECLQGKDSRTLINASMTVSQAGSYGTWAFLPVTDGTFVQDRPSVQFTSGKVNGVNGLFGNNANEGWAFVPQDLETEEELRKYLKITFPRFSNDNIKAILKTYPSSNAPEDPGAPLYAKNGEMGPTATNQSSVSSGQQQRANLIYGESTLSKHAKLQRPPTKADIFYSLSLLLARPSLQSTILHRPRLQIPILHPARNALHRSPRLLPLSSSHPTFLARLQHRLPHNLGELRHEIESLDQQPHRKWYLDGEPNSESDESLAGI